MLINIDDSAGFCWGVVQTIDKVEETLTNESDKNVYVLGQIIHNPHEQKRLEEKGLTTINHVDLNGIDSKKSRVIIRAHGEPPSTYKQAADLGIELVDATCPLVRNLQKTVNKFYENGWQIVIFGKREHAEVIGIRGVCNDECIVIKSADDAMNLVDFNKKTFLVSQTTMDKPTFFAIENAMTDKFKEIKGSDDIGDVFISKNSLCRFVYKREDSLIEFSKTHDLIIFVAGKNSSNGKSLYQICKLANENTIFIEDITDLDLDLVRKYEKIGITGATSTPQWYMQQVKSRIENNIIGN